MAEPTAASAGTDGADRIFVDNRDIAPLGAYGVDKELVVEQKLIVLLVARTMTLGGKLVDQKLIVLVVDRTLTLDGMVYQLEDLRYERWILLE